MTASNVPNLDAMEPDELMQFWFKHQRGYKSRDLFPNGGQGTKRATADLANYASNKAVAMRHRQEGDITIALQYEGICDRIYKELPLWARW